MEDEEESGGSEGWLVSYADLMTLLFAAFVVLYGTLESGTEDRVIGVLAAIRESFVEVSDIIPRDQEIGEIAKGQFVFKAYRGERLETEGAIRYNIKQDPYIPIDRDKNLVENLLDEIAATPDGIDMGLRQSMLVYETDRGFAIRFIGAYFFEEDSYRFTRRGRERFLRLGRMLRDFSRPMLIEGHDQLRSDASRYSADEMASLRAANAAKLLHEEVGIATFDLDTISYGSDRPIASAATKDGASKNRRIEIKINYDRR